MAGAAGFSPGETNAFRYRKLLLDVGTELYRDVFRSCYHPSTLQTFLSQPTQTQMIQQLIRGKVIKQHQYDLLHPRNTQADISKLDISLLYILIRNHSNFSSSPVWGASPQASDTSLEADIERIREKRNLVSHSEKRVMTDNEFRNNCADLKTIYLRMIAKIPNFAMSAQQLEDLVRSIMFSPVDLEKEKERQRQLNLWWNSDTALEVMYIRRVVETEQAQRKQESTDIKEGISEIQSELTKLGKTVEERSPCFESQEEMLIKKEMKARTESSRSELKAFFETERHHFTDTVAFEQARNKLRTNNAVIITGTPGTGKTYMSKVLVHELMQERNDVLPFYCHSPKDTDHVIIGSETPVLLVDDFCGKYCIEKDEFRIWKKKADKLTTYLKAKKLFLVITVRSTILSQIQNQITSFDCISDLLLQCAEVSLSTLTLTETEREQMIRKYISNTDVVDHEFLNQIANTKTPVSIGFPFLCKMAKARQSSRKEIERVFYTTDYITNELRQMHNTDKAAYLLLVTAMCCDGKITMHRLTDEEIKTAEEVANVLKDCSAKPKDMFDKAKSMTGTYFGEEDDRTYQLLHNSISEAIFASFWHEYPTECINISPVTLLTKLTHTNSINQFHVKKGLYEVLIQRYLNLIVSYPQAMDRMVQADVWESTDFIDCFRRCSYDSRYRDFFFAALHQTQIIAAFAAVGNKKMVKCLLNISRLKYQTGYETHIRSAIERASAWGQVAMAIYLIGLNVDPSDNALLCAAESGSVQMVETLTERGCDPENISSLETGNALHIACRSGHAQLAEILIQRYPNLLHERHKGLEPIFIAVSEGHINILKMIIDSKLVNVSITTEKMGFSLLHQACWSHQNDVAEYLARKYPELINITAKDRTTAIQTAAYGCRIDVLEHLFLCTSNRNYQADSLSSSGKNDPYKVGGIESTVTEVRENCSAKTDWLKQVLDNDKPNNSGLTIRHFACLGGQLTLTKHLIETYDPSFSVMKTNDGSSFLHCAASGGNIRVFRYLLDIGMHLYDVTNKGETVFHKACLANQLEMLSYLFDSFPDLQDHRTNMGETCLYYAAAGGEINTLKLAINNGMDVTDLTHCGGNVFHIAALNGRSDMLEYLHSKFPKIQGQRTPSGHTCLHIAAAGGHIDTFKYLLDTGMDVTDLSNKGENVFHMAAITGRSDMLEYLHSKFPKIQGQRTQSGHTCLHFAAACGHTDTFKYLVDTGMDVTDVANDGENVFHMAAITGKSDTLEYLHSKFPEIQGQRTQSGHTCLHLAAAGGHTDTFKYLLETGMDATDLSNDGLNVFHIAAINGRSDMLEYLHSKCPEIHEQRTQSGHTCLHLAAAGGHTDTFKYLLETGMDATDLSNDGLNVFHIAAINGRSDMLEYLHSKCPEIHEQRTQSGHTCLHLAAAGGHTDTFKYLLETGMDVTDLTNNGENVFHAAARDGRTNMLEYLHSNLPQMQAHRQRRGETCLHYAAAGGHTEAVKYLVECGMDVKDVSQEGENIFHLAAANGKTDTLKYLHSNFPDMKGHRTERGQTCFILAFVGGHIETLKYLMGVGLDVRDAVIVLIHSLIPLPLTPLLCFMLLLHLLCRGERRFVLDRVYGSQLIDLLTLLHCTVLVASRFNICR